MPTILAFHAHPDDEVTSTGGTLARYAADGHTTVVVTATDGAVGEIHNYEDPDSLRERLPDIRAAELADALDILGVEESEFLGYRDSGMMGTDDNAHPESFWQADFMEATRRLVSSIRRHRPDVVVIYDPFGGYGHPDHIQVHRIGMAAFFGASDLGRFPLSDDEEMHIPQKLYWSAWPRSRVGAFADMRLAAGLIEEDEAARMRNGGVPDEDIDAWIHVADFLGHKDRAWRAHRTQIPEDWWFFQVPEELRPEIMGREAYIRIHSRVPVDGIEDDLFNGLE